ncbi:hypothetical protein CLV30_12537 [Haloactinopolyspora alba]|uniref:Uncharacterized protein n=1 Tax=Haloactinopolyspora alba TaxID=648780 RepID=A0A2P8DHH0_9ACTN|nr:hypothetical protein [Haloactinopolyspora alba]PSK96656.1 hypothetical protein CLV30_12537 [Haloactinopolyspora alba]
MTCHDGRRHATNDLRPDEFEVTMLRVERWTEIAVRITRNAAKILTIALGAVLTGLWSLHQVVELFR